MPKMKRGVENRQKRDQEDMLNGSNIAEAMRKVLKEEMSGILSASEPPVLNAKKRATLQYRRERRRVLRLF